MISFKKGDFLSVPRLGNEVNQTHRLRNTVKTMCRYDTIHF